MAEEDDNGFGIFRAKFADGIAGGIDIGAGVAQGLHLLHHRALSLPHGKAKESQLILATGQSLAYVRVSWVINSSKRVGAETRRLRDKEIGK